MTAMAGNIKGTVLDKQTKEHTLMLPKGYLQVLGFTDADMKARNAGLAGDEETMDWLFY